MNHPEPAAHMAKTELDFLPIASIRPSGTPIQNLRRARFMADAEGLLELAASIAKEGVLQPIIVRPITPEGHLKYELVAGERRWIAADRAGLAHVPAIIRPDLTAAQVLTTQLIENKQRDDYTPLEEAQGYKDLMELEHLNAQQVGDAIGKSRAHVWARRKLLDLCPEARQALQKGVIDASKALILARVPGEKLQQKGLALVTETNWRGEPISFKEALTKLREKCMQPLVAAPFALDDATLNRPATKDDPGYLVHEWSKQTLVSNRDGSDDYACQRCPAKFKRRRLDQDLPVGPCKPKHATVELPSCHDCPSFSGNDPELQRDLGDRQHVCTDVPCYEAKVAGVLLRRKQQAEQAGTPIVSGDAAKKIAPRKDKLVGFVDLDDPCEWDKFPEPEPEPGEGEDEDSPAFRQRYEAWDDRAAAWPGRSYRQLLGDAKVDITLLEDPKTGAVRELVSLKQVKQLLNKQHEIKLPGYVGAPEPKPQPHVDHNARYKKEQEARDAREAKESAFRTKVLQAIAAKCSGPLKRDELADIADTLIEDEEVEDGLKSVYDKIPEPGHLKDAELGKLIRLALIARPVGWIHDSPGPLLAAAKRYKVNVDQIKATIAAEERAAAKAAKAAAAAEKAKPRPPESKPATKKGRAITNVTTPLQPSEALAVIVGKAKLTRTDVTKKVWAYIKKHGLQDKKNKRFINPDEKLRPILGGKTQVSMFEMTQLLSEQLS